MFDFLKKNKGEAPPDIGQEEVFDAKKENTSKPAKDSKEVAEEKLPEVKPQKSLINSNVGGEAFKLEIEKLNMRINAAEALMKGYSERFGNINERLGEVRSMNLTTEKSIAKASEGSAKAIDIVKEVKPEKLRIDYQRMDIKTKTLAEKIEAGRQFSETVMNEVKDLRRKAGIFVGTDALLKLNEDIKKDLIEVQKIGSRVRANAEKSEEVFIELRRGIAESKKMEEVVKNIESSQSELKDEISKLRVDYSNILKKSDFEDFQKTFNTKFGVAEDYFKEIDKIKKENKRLSEIIESTLSISKENKKDIEDIAINIGDEHIRKVSDYENKLTALLNVVGALAGQVSEIKKKLGIQASKRFSINKINKNKLQTKPVKIAPQIPKQLISKPIIPKYNEVKNIKKSFLPKEKKEIKEILLPKPEVIKEIKKPVQKKNIIKKVIEKIKPTPQNKVVLNLKNLDPKDFEFPREKEIVIDNLKDIAREVQIAKDKKMELFKYFKQLEREYVRGEIPYSVYLDTLNHKRNGRSIREWIEYYDNYIKEYNQRIQSEKNKGVEETKKIVSLFKSEKRKESRMKKKLLKEKKNIETKIKKKKKQIKKKSVDKRKKGKKR